MSASTPVEGQPVRLALALGGTGSGGAYVAGALRRVLEILGSAPAGGITVDVITGSGSGTLNAALAARALAINPSVSALLRNVWVDGLGFDQLFRPERCSWDAVFDPASLKEFADALITADPAADDEASPLAGDPIQLGLISGGHADDYSIPADVGASGPVWRRVRDRAVAGMAFPLLSPTRAAGGEEIVGPLELAGRLTARTSGGTRGFLLIDPDVGAGPVGGAAAPSTAGALIDALADAARGRARLDLARGRNAGERAEILARLVTRLPELADRVQRADAFDVGRHVGELAERVAEMRAPRAGGGDDPAMAYLDRALSRIDSEPTYARLLSGAEGRAVRTRLAKLVFVLEAIAGDGVTADGSVHAIRPAEGELACTGLGGLGGFVEREWRAHDFRAGQRDADRWFEDVGRSIVGAKAGARDSDGGQGARPAPPPPLSLEGRDRLRRLSDALVDRWLEDIGPGALAGLFGWAWKPSVRAWAARTLVRGVVPSNARRKGAEGKA